MHFIVGEDERVHDFHIEMWDRAIAGNIILQKDFYRNRKQILNNLPFGPAVAPVTVQELICRSCGMPLPSAAKFCNRCGQTT